MKSFALAVLFLLSTSAPGALPGVTEFNAAPEAVTDTELSGLLGAHLAKSDVIAIGESVHGSSGFLRVQTRLIRYLVEQHGLRLIVWENPVLRSVEMSRWAAACTSGKSPAPLDVLYWPTEADRPLFDWICDFNNADPGEPIVFRGMDVWDRPWEHYARIQALGGRAGIELPALQTIRASCPAHAASSWPEVEAIYAQVERDGRFLPEAGYEKCRAALTAVLNGARRSGLEKRQGKDPGSEEAFELALSASTLLGWLGFYHYNWSDDVLSWNERDRAQGRNLALLMEKHGAGRAILSAHTSHVSHNRSPADWWGYGDLKSGVHFFAAETGRRVFNIALTAYDASGSQGDWSAPTASNSLDRKLREAGHRFSFFAADAAFLAESPKWWMQNGNAPGPHANGVEIAPRDHFDAWFFLDRSRLDEALPRRPVWQH